MPSAVDPAANLIDIRCNAADGGSQLFLFGVIDLDDVPVDQHLPGIRAEVAGSKRAHFMLNEIPFRFIQAEFLRMGRVRSGIFLISFQTITDIFAAKHKYPSQKILSLYNALF